MQVDEYPEQMSAWKQRAKWLSDGFHPTSKQAKAQFEELLELCNGDSMKPNLVHWCKGCCHSDDDALQKVTKLLVPLFCRGYQVPLLYRFKHYSTASSYIRTACCFFNLLPQVLSQMKSNMDNKTDPASKLSSVVDELLKDSGGHFVKEDGTGTDFQTMLDDLLENDLSYSLQNSIRKRKVMEEMSKQEFVQSAILIDVIVDALEYGSNLMFKRTSILTRMSGLGGQHPLYQELADESTKYFMQIISGRLGRSLMESTANLLGSGLTEMSLMGFDATTNQMDLFFKLIVACMSDLWRRMVFEYMAFPYRWFDLLNPQRTFDDFIRLWDDGICARQQACSCVDHPFTEGFMDNLATISEKPSPETFREAKTVLHHIAMCSPLTADSVEVKHGQMQWCISKRGSQFVKKGKSAVESALLQGIIKNHAILREDISSQTMPASRIKSTIERQIGVKSKNQHSANAPTEPQDSEQA